jgi:hypothetical protein
MDGPGLEDTSLHRMGIIPGNFSSEANNIFYGRNK